MKAGILRAKAVEHWTGLSRSTIDRLEAEGKFPKRRKIGPSCVGWSAAEIEAWFESKASTPLSSGPYRSNKGANHAAK